MNHKLYDYIVSKELMENPYTTPPAVTTANCSLYFNEEARGVPITDLGGGYFLR